MNNYYKNKDLPKDVQAIKRNQEKNNATNLSHIKEKEEKIVHPLYQTYTYQEAKKLIRRVDRWALNRPYVTGIEKNNNEILMEKVESLKNGLIEITSMVKENEADYPLALLILDHKLFKEEVENAYQLSLVTDSLLGIFKVED